MNISARLTLIAALITGLGAMHTSVSAATAQGTANATVLTPIIVTAGTALNFGTFSANATGGTVVMSTGGVRSVTGTVVGATSAPGTNGTFTVTGTVGSTFGVTYPTSFNVTSGANTMAVALNVAATGTLSTSSVSLPVGGTLTVGAAQAAGSYTGTYTLTVEYN